MNRSKAAVNPSNTVVSRLALWQRPHGAQHSLSKAAVKPRRARAQTQKREPCALRGQRPACFDLHATHSQVLRANRRSNAPADGQAPTLAPQLEAQKALLLAVQAIGCFFSRDTRLASLAQAAKARRALPATWRCLRLAGSRVHPPSSRAPCLTPRTLWSTSTSTAVPPLDERLHPRADRGSQSVGSAAHGADTRTCHRRTKGSPRQPRAAVQFRRVRAVRDADAIHVPVAS